VPMLRRSAGLHERVITYAGELPLDRAKGGSSRRSGLEKDAIEFFDRCREGFRAVRYARKQGIRGVAVSIK